MSAHRLLPTLSLACAGVGAPFVMQWGWIPCAVGLVLAIAALFVVPAERRVERRAAWAVTVGAGLALGIAFTVQVAAPNIVVAGQKAAGRQAVATLRTLLWAQDQAVRDHGRAGLVGELSSARAMGDGRPLDVPLLRDPFKRLKPGATGAVVDFGGYTYQMWIFGPDGARYTDAVPGQAPTAVPAGAVRWLAYAWPSDPGTTGYRAFCINRYEDILEAVDGARYAGADSPPPWDACITGDGPEARLVEGTGGDGGVWKRWRGKETRRGKASGAAP